jgi:hypothetical protein
MRHIAPFVLLAAAGAAIAVAPSAQAAGVINISGATLFESFFAAPAATNDYIDVDGNGTAGSLGSFSVQQLASPGVPPPTGSTVWCIQYRATGSGNGLAELVSYVDPVNADATSDGDSVGIESSNAENAYYNRTKFIDKNTGLQAIANASNPGAYPVTHDASYNALYTAPGAFSGGVGAHVHLSVLDVPSIWFVVSGNPANASPALPPGSDGYGLNPLHSVNKSGGSAGADKSNTLKSLGPYNTNTGSPDANTVFDTQIAYVPIAAITNYGTGLQEITKSQLQWMAVTGRMPNGVNLIQVTRDSGSGTRNGYMNSLCTDPSWGVGENIGPKSEDPALDIVGPDFIPSNKGGSGSMEATVKNVRLGIGYTGAERGDTKGWLTSGQLDCLGVKDDFNGGAVFARPDIDSVLDNNVDGYTVGGAESFVSRGDPRAESLADGGDANGNPTMDNPNAAAFLNNITRSIDAFVTTPGGDQSLFMPGELLALNYVLAAATDNVQDLADPCNLIPNPAFNASLQAFTRANNLTFNLPEYSTFGFHGTTGINPVRTTGVAYSDATAPGGSATGDRYVNQAGNPVSYAQALDARNTISGDANGDGLRNWNDIPEMMKAFRQRSGGAAWSAPDGIYGANAGDDACIEILLDFNCDGSFDAQDVRYFADGLATDPSTGALSRVEGFTRVDNASAVSKGIGDLNFFGTTLANPSATYDAGDSRADVAGSGGQTRWFQPIGHDGAVDADDIDYVFANYGDWSLIDEAAQIDLSCDMNDDLVVDVQDVCTILGILETSFGDVDLNGTVDAADLAIAQNTIDNLNGMGGWALGDMTGDGLVDQDDLDIINGVVDPCTPPSVCTGDLDGDGDVDIFDFGIFAPNFGSMGHPPFTNGDFDGDGDVDVFDFGIFAPNFGCLP